jgi:hypothetical protein
VCATSVGFARSNFGIDNLAPGTYSLVLNLGNRKTTGSLLIQTDRVELSTCDTNLVAVRQPLLRRIPPNTIFGHASAGASPAAQAVVLSLRDSLIRLGAQPLTLPPGTYGWYFGIDQNGNYFLLSPRNPPPAVFAGTVLTYTGSFARIRAFRERYRSYALTMSLSSTGGETVY